MGQQLIAVVILIAAALAFVLVVHIYSTSRHPLNVPLEKKVHDLQRDNLGLTEWVISLDYTSDYLRGETFELRQDVDDLQGQVDGLREDITYKSGRT